MDFLPSLGIIFLSGIFMGNLAKKGNLPPLIGMILAGILLGNSGIGCLGTDILSISPDLRKIALVMILLKAGLTLDSKRLKTVGKPALLLAFLPALMEIFACTLIAPLIFGITKLEALLLGSVLAAVSPAVVVPRMVSFIERKIGAEKKMPEIILAGASLDDVFVMVLFSTFLSMVAGGELKLFMLLEIPLSIATGLFLGVHCGKTLSKLESYKISPLELQILILFALSCGFFGLEHMFPFSALLAVMSLGLSMELFTRDALAAGFTSLWKGAEILLFVLLGAEVNVAAGFSLGFSGLFVLIFGLAFRSLGVCFATKSPTLGKKEQYFAIISYLPKATVQAGIGGLPLAMGLDCGELILTMAVLSILVTAPLGAYLLDKYGEKILESN